MQARRLSTVSPGRTTEAAHMNEYQRHLRAAQRRDRIRRIITAVVAWALILFMAFALIFALWLFIGLSFALFGTPPGVGS